MRFFLFLICLQMSLLADDEVGNFNNHPKKPDHVVTYALGSRFGDNLLSYLHAKWISYQYQIPLRYQPFKYSSNLVLHDREVQLSDDPNKNKRINLGVESGTMDLQREDSVMYVCPYFSGDNFDSEKTPYFVVDWKNEEFRSIVRDLIAPNKRLHLVTCSNNDINVAIHVREGGGYDRKGTPLGFPLKLPPMSFYVEGLSKIVSMFPNKEIRCHVFTDALDPKKIVRILQSAVPKNHSVRFTYRGFNNNHKSNVLEDFFSLFNFDVLIRPQSNFSMVPSLIHDYAIIYTPVRASVVGDQVVIEKTNIELNEDLYQKLLLKETSSSNFLSKVWSIFGQN